MRKLTKVFIIAMMIISIIFVACMPKQFSLTITATNGMVSVKIGGETITDSSPYMIEEGSLVTITANADNGYSFDEWSGDIMGIDNPITFTMNEDKSITATFIEDATSQYILITNVVGNGIITLDPAGGIYSENTIVSASATPDNGYSFDGWSGDIHSSANPLNLLMDENKNITVTFTIDPPEINVKEGTTDLPDSYGTFDFGEFDEMSSSSPVTFTIENTGGDDLIINNISIDDITNFTLTDNTVSPVSGGDSTSFDITFNPQIYGNHSGIVTIETNDPHLGTYNFNVTGKGKNVWTLADNININSSGVRSVAFNPAGTQIVSGNTYSTITLCDWDGTSITLINSFSGHSIWVNSVDFNHDGTQIVSGSTDDTIKVWNWDGTFATIADNLLDTDNVNSVAFNPAGTQIVSGSDDNTIKVWNWDGSSGSLKDAEYHTDNVNSVAFNPAGTQIVSGSDDNTIKVWNCAGSSLTLVDTLTDHLDNVRSVAFNHNGTQIVSGSSTGNPDYDGIIKVWDWDGVSGTLIATLTGHTDRVYSVAFNPAGTQIVSGGDDHTVKVWDWDGASGTLAANLTGHTLTVYSVAFNYDGTQIISGSNDDTIKIWE